MIASAFSSCGPQSHRREWKTSPIRHSEWTRTSTGSSLATCPITSATGTRASTVVSYAIAVKSPKSVGSLWDAIRRTSFSFTIRYSIRSLIVIIFRPWVCASSWSCGTRAIPPSSSRTSQMTPAG